MKKSTLLKITAIASLVIIAVLGSVYGYISVRDYIKVKRDAEALDTARQFLKDNRPGKAFELLKVRDQGITGNQQQWLHLELDVLEHIGNADRLRYLYDRNPGIFSGHEAASIMVARSMLATRDFEEFTTLRSSWQQIKSRPESWFALDIDALIVQGEVEKAIEKLQDSSLEGEADAVRLTRLALLTSNLQEAWGYLERAFRIAPKNPDVRSFRAQILERMGKRDMARVEYVAAHLTDTSNPLYRDQLAEFYRRYDRLDLAVQTWAQDLDDRSADFIWLKALFWSKVATPTSLDSATPSDLYGALAPLVMYLQDLPQEAFWDEGVVKKYALNTRGFLEQRQEIYWLRILQAIKDDREQQAYELLLSHPFKRSSWNPDIEQALEQVLAYRLEQPQPVDAQGFFSRKGPASGKHQLFGQLDRLTTAQVPEPALRNLLQSKAIFPAIFMAGGWREAALQLRAHENLSDTFPDWFAYGMAQSIRFNRGAEQALHFIEKQKQTSHVRLLKGELLLASGKLEAGMEQLELLSGSDSAIGFRAAWLLTLAYRDMNEVAKARGTLAKQPQLGKSITGQEIKARIALAEGRPDDADSIYTSLKTTSPEAMAWLAKKAFRAKEWQTARDMTMALQKQYPDRMQLRANLNAIDEAELEDTARTEGTE